MGRQIDREREEVQKQKEWRKVDLRRKVEVCRRLWSGV